MKKLAILIWFIPSLAFAQAQKPTDVEILQLEAKAAEAESSYYAILVRKLQIEAKETADWWAKYIGKADVVSQN